MFIVFPTIYGEIKLLSIIWMIKTVIITKIVNLVEVVIVIATTGAAPIIGPKYGIIFVSPMMIASNNAYFTPRSWKTINVSKLTMAETSNCTRIYHPNLLFMTVINWTTISSYIMLLNFFIFIIFDYKFF